jgi:hypothetical protein
MMLPLVAAAALLSVGGAASAAAPVDPALLAQDRMAIEETLRRYVRGLDDADLDGYLATLTEDARFVAEEGTHVGKEAIRKYVEPVMKSRAERRARDASSRSPARRCACMPANPSGAGSSRRWSPAARNTSATAPRPA